MQHPCDKLKEYYDFTGNYRMKLEIAAKVTKTPSNTGPQALPPAPTIAEQLEAFNELVSAREEEELALEKLHECYQQNGSPKQDS